MLRKIKKNHTHFAVKPNWQNIRQSQNHHRINSHSFIIRIRRKRTPPTSLNAAPIPKTMLHAQMHRNEVQSRQVPARHPPHKYQVRIQCEFDVFCFDVLTILIICSSCVFTVPFVSLRWPAASSSIYYITILIYFQSSRL